MTNILFKFNSIFKTHQKYSALQVSSLSLIFSNLITIFIALWQNWNLADLIWVYWLQSVIIGYFQQKKIKEVENYSTDRFYMNDKPVEANYENKQKVANLFILIYGLFHFFYIIFILTYGLPDFSWLAFLGLMFFVNHYFSYLENKEKDRKIVQNIGEMMFFPYLRIIPMHLIIILGHLFMNDFPLVIFLLLQTFVDVVMHNLEHSRGEVLE